MSMNLYPLTASRVVPEHSEFIALPCTRSLVGVPRAYRALVRPLLRAKDFSAKEGEALLLFPRGRGLARRVLLVGLGDASRASAWRHAGGVIARKIVDGTFTAPSVLVPIGTKPVLLDALAQGMYLGQWKLKRSRDDAKRRALPEGSAITVVTSVNGASAILERSRVVSSGILEARRLANTPAGLLQPEDLEREVRQLAQLRGVEVEVWDAARLGKERMGCILAVGQASQHAPRLAIVRCNAPDPRQAIVLVGKGVCFDSGGYNVKTTPSIEDMYVDMAGVATIVGALRIMQQQPRRVPVIAVFPIVENLISGNAYKPGDILTARNGLTIEVNNTDAEGRLILADALALASEWKPRCIIDVATLTGAALVAVGDRFNAFYTSDDALATELLDAGLRTDEPNWRMPLHPDYARWIEGKRADLRNLSRMGTLASASAAAEFLRKFVDEKIPFAHLDLSAAQQHDVKPPDIDGCNGTGVRMLVEFLRTSR